MKKPIQNNNIISMKQIKLKSLNNKLLILLKNSYIEMKTFNWIYILTLELYILLKRTFDIEERIYILLIYIYWIWISLFYKKKSKTLLIKN